MIQSTLSLLARCLLFAALSLGMTAGPGARPLSTQLWETAEERCAEVTQSALFVRRAESSRPLPRCGERQTVSQHTAEAILRGRAATARVWGHPEQGHRLRNSCLAPILV